MMMVFMRSSANSLVTAQGIESLAFLLFLTFAVVVVQVGWFFNYLFPQGFIDEYGLGNDYL
jgi:hypothetical protein